MARASRPSAAPLLPLWFCAVSLLATQAAGHAVPLSSHECIEGATDYDRVCFFKDVYLHKGQLHYVSGDPALALPKVHANFGRMDDPGWLRVPVVTPAAAEAAWNSSAGVEEVGTEDVYLWSTQVDDNWYHFVGEYLPTLHNTLCKYLGRCTYDNVQGVRIFEMLEGTEARPWAGFMNDTLACFSDQPRVAAAHPSVAGRVLRLRRALAGVGPDCRGWLYCKGDPQWGGRQRIPPEKVAGFRRRLGECLGYDPGRQAAVEPARVVFIDRHYASARHVLNLRQVLQALHSRYGGLLNVSVHYLEGASARDQVQLWNAADILIHVHGAAQGSYGFLPRDAQALHIVQHPRGEEHDNSYPEAWVRDLVNTTDVKLYPVVNKAMRFAQLKKELVFGQAVWRKLNVEQRLQVIEHGNCAVIEDHADRTTCDMYWIHKNLNLVLRPELLMAQLDRALEELYRRHGKPPPGLPPLPGDPDTAPAATA